MEIAIVPATLAVASPTSRAFSSLRHLSGSDQLRFPTLSFDSPLRAPRSLTIRMGGGPRTFPGGVSKWQWKRMQAKKAKQLLKARLCRERQLYEMRKRAELKAAVAELEKPWEVVERAPTLFSAKADEQVKALADRFQKPGGFDMWTEKDGPQVFRTPDGLPSARFFPKGVVHSVRPYGIGEGEGEMRFDDWIARGGGHGGGGSRRSLRRSSDHRHGREGSEVLDVGSDEGIAHTRCLMNVQKDGGGAMMDVNYGHEDGGEVGIDGWNGSKRSMRRSPSRRRGRDGPETEFVVAEFEDSVEQGEEVSRNADSSFKSRNWGFSKMEEGNAMVGGHGSAMDELGSSRFSRKSGGLKKSYDEQGGASSSRYLRDSKIEKGNAMGGGRRYGGGAPYGRGQSSDQRSYASDPETTGWRYGTPYGRGQSSDQRSYASDLETTGRRYGRGAPYGRGQSSDQRSYASDPETTRRRYGRGDPYGRGQSSDQRSYASDPETTGRRYGRGAPYGRGQSSDQRSYAYASDPETTGRRYGRGAPYGREQSSDQRSYVSDPETTGRRYGRGAPYRRGHSSDRRSYASHPETIGAGRVDGSRMDEQMHARGSYGRGRRSYASDSETMRGRQDRHVGSPPYGRGRRS